jgi:tetratricopeptide (TPR) repeat protein
MAMVYAVTLAPVIVIIHVGKGKHAMADRYTYLPLIGIGIVLVWGIPLLLRREDIRKKVLLPAGIFILAILTVLTWHQCSYWKNSIELFSHTLHITPDYTDGYYNRGLAYFLQGNKERGCHDAQKACELGNCKLLENAKGKGLCR